jgi:UDP-N-acetylmuramoylalanine-D-glutamate ligase
VSLEGAKVGVMGIGVSGEAAARFLMEQGAKVVATDLRPEKDLGDSAAPEPAWSVGATVPGSSKGATWW